eukprot:Opistho-1_new@20736
MRLEEGAFGRCLNQVGGHKAEEGKGKSLLVADGLVLKPLQSKGRGAKEREFYEEVLASKSEELSSLRKFLPRFHGVSLLTAADGAVTEYIRLEDISCRFARPSVLDVKMGRRSYGEDASPEKIAYELSKYPPQMELGFRFTGMHVFDVVRGEHRSYGRKYGHALTVESVRDGFVEYLSDGVRVRRDVIPGFLARLTDIREWFLRQRLYRFYSSSLLFVYEGDGSSAAVDVRCIDFAHVYPVRDGGRDDGYVYGIERVIALFATLLAEGAPTPCAERVMAPQEAPAAAMAECA